MLSSSPGREEDSNLSKSTGSIPASASRECLGCVLPESESLIDISMSSDSESFSHDNTKRRTKSAGPRLEIVKSITDPGPCDTVPDPFESPPVTSVVSPARSDINRSSSDVRPRGLVIGRSEEKTLEGLNLKSSLSPNLRFQCLNSLLQQSSAEDHKSSEGSEGPLSSPDPSSVERILVLDPVVGPPAKEKISQLGKEECSRQPRIVSVKREECMKKEHAAIFVQKEAAAKQHRAVTVSRSHTWNVHNKDLASESGQEYRRRVPVARNTSMLGKSSASQEAGAFSDDEMIVSAKDEASESGGAKSRDGESNTETASKLESELDTREELLRGETKSPEMQGQDAQRRILRSQSVRHGSLRKTDSPKNVSWLDVERDAEIGLLSRDGLKECDRKERMKEDEQMERLAPPRNDSAMTPEEDGQRVQRCVIVHRDEKGFGFTVCGNNPVHVESVKPNGPAYKAGVQQYDRIVKVNGTLVINCNHTEVVKLIKSGSYVALTLLGRPPVHTPPKALDSLEQGVATPTTATPQTPSLAVEKDQISGPRAVDPDKDQQFKAQRVTTIQMMYKQVLEEYEKMKQEYQKSPNETLQYKLQVKLQMLRRVEDQLRAIDASQPQVSSPPSSTPGIQSPGSSESSLVLPLKRPATLFGSTAAEKPDLTEPVERHASSPICRGPTPWMPSGPKHRKADSMPDPLYKIDEDYKDGSNATRSRNSEERDVRGDQTTEDVDLPSVSSVESSGIQSASSGFTDHASASETTALDVMEVEASSVPASHQPLRSELVKSKLKVVSPHQVKVVIMDDTDFSTVDDPGVFSDLMQLKHRPAHMAVFLHYLVSNSDPAAMLFYLVTDSYASGNIKEMKKWAYEIFSTFLCDRAPLKINVDEATVTTVSMMLQTKSDREDVMKNIFQSARIFAQNEINDHLTDFRSKRALGLGSLYGDRDLKDNMDRQTEMRIVEAALWKHFERLAQDEETDRSQAMASALATFFKQIGYTSQKNNSLLERCSSFNAKDKKVFKFKSNNKKVIHTNGHQFIAQHYVVTTFCFYCQNVLWGIGNQGYQCTNCDINLHKNCIDIYKDSCSGGSSSLRKKKERRPPSMFDLISRKLSNTNPAAIREAQHQHFGTDFHLATPTSVLTVRPGLPEGDEADVIHRSISSNIGNATESDKSPDEMRSVPQTLRDQSPDNYEEEYNPNVLSVGLGRSESLNQRSGIRASVRRTHSDVSPDNQMQPPQPANSGSSSNSSLSARASDSSEGLNDISGTPPTSVIAQKSQYSDSDFDVETELPLLESVIPKELFRKLKPKEKKRQEVINELFYTERTHVRNLKVLDRIFYHPMADDPLALILFPNLEEITEIHCALNNELKARRQESPVVGDFAEILVKRFSGEEGEKFKMAAARFCEQQSHALEVLRQRQRKDQKLATFLQEASSNSLCRRLELKDLILTELQRLTKYPLLIESLLKYTVSNTEEYDQLLKAHDYSKDLLNHVNHRVEECENQQKLAELQKRLDRRPIENSTHPVVSEYKKLDLTRHKMIYDGILTWRINRSKHIDNHVILFEDILVLLQKQDDRLVLRCQSGNREPGKDDSKLTHSPIIKLNNVLTRNVATDKRAFFLVNISETIGPQIYELAASTKDERNKWFKYITDAAEAYKAKDGVKGKRPPTTIGDASHLPDSQDHPPVDDNEGSAIYRGKEKPSDKTTPTIGDDHQPDDGIDIEADDRRERADSLESVGRVEVLNFEPPQLVQPNEVKVSRMEVMEKLEPIKTPLDFLREKNRLIQMTMTEKKKLVASLLNIPLQDYDHIAEIAGEVVESQDVKELLFGSLAKADELTRLISEGLDESIRQRMDSPGVSRRPTVTTRRPGTGEEAADDDVTPTSSVGLATCSELTHEMAQVSHLSECRTIRHLASAGPTIALPSSRLISITGQLQRHLVQLMDMILKKDPEKESPELMTVKISDQSKSSRVMTQGMSPLQPETSRLACSRVEPTEEVAEATPEQPRCVKLSASLVTFPVVMEHVEVIEVETIVTEPSVGAPLPLSALQGKDLDSSATTTANVSVVPANESEPSNSRET